MSFGVVGTAVSSLSTAQVIPSQGHPFYEEGSPRCVVVLNGKRYQISEYSVELNAHGSTDQASVTMPIISNPDFSLDLFRGANDTKPVLVQIYAGYGGAELSAPTDVSQLHLRFSGIVDNYVATEESDTVIFSCRSLAAPLVDNKLTTPIQGVTSTQFVQAQAAQFGLTAKVNLATAPVYVQEVFAREFIGGYSFASAIYNKHIWDVLLECAQFDDADVWVDAQGVLHYESPWLVQRQTIPLHYGRDLIGATITHAPQFAKDVKVEIRTYQPRLRQSTATRVSTQSGGGVVVKQSSRTASSSPIFGTTEIAQTSISNTGQISNTVSSVTGGSFNASNSSSTESAKEPYIFYVRNITPQRANQLALSKWRQISMHEFGLDLKIAVTKSIAASLSISSLLQVSGLSYRLADAKYWPRRITEAMSAHEGWTIHLHAVNHVLPQGAV